MLSSNYLILSCIILSYTWYTDIISSYLILSYLILSYLILYYVILILSSWADLVEGLVPQALASAIQSNRGLRAGLPRDYLDYMGVVHSDEVLVRNSSIRFYLLILSSLMIVVVRQR